MPNPTGPSDPPAPSTPAPLATTRGTRAKTDDATTLRDARDVLSAVKKHAAQFVLADKKKKIKRIDAPWITKFAALVKQGGKARGGQRALAVQASGVTTQEIAARDALYDAAARIRDDIATSFTDDGDDELRRAFGVGARAKVDVTSSVTEFADSIVAAYANDDWRARVVDAGITPKTIADLQALREALAGFGAQRTAQVNQRAAATQAKNATIASIRKLTAYARKVADTVFRGDAKSLRDFASGTPRRTPKPRGSAKKTTRHPKKRARVAPPRGGKKKKKRD